MKSFYSIKSFYFNTNCIDICMWHQFSVLARFVKSIEISSSSLNGTIFFLYIV